MNYLSEEKICQLINKVEKSMFSGEILSCKLDGSDVYTLHEALMVLQYLIKQGFIKFDDDGFVVY